MTDTAGVYANDPLMRKVSLAIDVQHFTTQDKVGRYLIERAAETRASALEALSQADPTDAGSILKLQWEARVPDLFLAWLEEALEEGDAAERNIAIEDSTL